MTSIGEDLSDWRFARVVKESPNEAHDAIVDDLSAASIPWVAPDILNGAYGRSDHAKALERQAEGLRFLDGILIVV